MKYIVFALLLTLAASRASAAENKPAAVTDSAHHPGSRVENQLLTSDKAIEIAKKDVTAKNGGEIKSPEAALSMYRSLLIYEVRFVYSHDKHTYVYHIDAKSGRIIDKDDTTRAKGKKSP